MKKILFYSYSRYIFGKRPIYPNGMRVCITGTFMSCMRVDKREFAWEFHQLSCPGQTRTRVAWELTSESLHESFINSHGLVKREQELHESWQARVYMRVSSTLMAWSNENKSCMRVDKREFAWEFHQLSCPWSNENKSCMRVNKREFA